MRASPIGFKHWQARCFSGPLGPGDLASGLPRQPGRRNIQEAPIITSRFPPPSSPCTARRLYKPSPSPCASFSESPGFPVARRAGCTPANSRLSIPGRIRDSSRSRLARVVYSWPRKCEASRSTHPKIFATFWLRPGVSYSSYVSHCLSRSPLLSPTSNWNAFSFSFLISATSFCVLSSFAAFCRRRLLPFIFLCPPRVTPGATSLFPGVTFLSPPVATAVTA